MEQSMEFEFNAQQSVERYEKMLIQNAVYFFDIEEFEDIIAYYLEHNNTQKAQQAIQIGLQQHPNASNLFYRKAELYAQIDMPEKALKIIQDIEMIESNSDMLMLKASLYSQLGISEKAIDTYKILLNYTDEEIGEDEICYMIGLEYENINNYQKSIQYFIRGFLANTDNFTLLEEMRFAYNALNQNDKCVSTLISYIDDMPYHEMLWFQLAMAYENLTMYEKAIEAFDYAIAINDEFFKAYLYKANTLVLMDEYDLAIEVYHEIIKLEGDTPSAIINFYLAECYENNNQSGHAIEYYEKCVAIDDTFEEAYYGMAYIYFQNEKYLEASVYIETALELDDQNADYLHLLANIYFSMKQFEIAEKNFTKSLSIDPLNADAWIDYSELLLEYKMIDEAIVTLKKSLEYIDNDVYLYVLLAGLLFTTDRQTEAFMQLETALMYDDSALNELYKAYPSLEGNSEIINYFYEMVKS